MTEAVELAGPDPDPPVPPGRGRRIVMVAIVLALVASMVFLAFISGRGVVTVPPDTVPRSTVSASATLTTADVPRLAVIDPDGHLLTMDATGSAVTAVGGPDTQFSFPAWSPDGTRIAVIGTTAADIAVYVFTPPTNGGTAADPVILYHSADRPPFYLYWAPDGRRVTFLTTEPTGLALRIAPADGSAPAAQIQSGAPLYWAWAGPDRLLVHSGIEGGGGFLGTIGLDGAALDRSAAAPGSFRVPAVTADARFRAFASPGSPEQVVVETTDGVTRHATTVFGTAALDFGSSGDELAFIAPSAVGQAQALPIGPLRLLDAASGAGRTLLAGPVVGFFWSPDGATLAALQLPQPGDDNVASDGGIVLARSVGPGASRTTPVSAAAAVPGIPLRLVFVTVGSGVIRSQRTVQVSDAFVQQLLPYFDQYALSHHLWSPDGASIILPLVGTDGTVDLTSIRADGSETRVVTVGVSAFWPARP
jgi:TolB protein